VRVHIVSDIHGNSEALSRAGEHADALIVLGDLVDFVDYHDNAGGILGAVFGARQVSKIANFRKDGNFLDMRRLTSELWATLDDPAGTVAEAVREQYARLFGAMTAPTYATPGNVDVPELWSEFATDSITILDGSATTIGGLDWGFVGGSVLPPGRTLTKSPIWTPYMRTEDDYAEAVAKLGPVDVLCSHVPPQVPELTYDVVAKRAEHGSIALLAHIREHRPRYSFFGHVHQPLARRRRVSGTECVNVGHFQRTSLPYVLTW
jgi:Icc-related predicted phosphoesterase